MLTVTPQASEVIKEILSDDEAPDDGVVRISPAEEQGLTIEVVAAPEAEDQLIEGDGVEICVEQGIVEVLEDKQLDAGTAGENVAFMISPKGSRNGRPDA